MNIVKSIKVCENWNEYITPLELPENDLLAKVIIKVQRSQVSSKPLVDLISEANYPVPKINKKHYLKQKNGK